MSAISSFRKDLKHLTQMSYLLGSGVSMVAEARPSSISRQLRIRIESLCTDGQTVTAAALKTAQVRSASGNLSSFLADLLLVYLDAVVHVGLAERAGVPADVLPPSVEALVATLWDGGAIGEWWFRDIVLLSEIRNRVIHADGAVSLPCARLLAAGWTEAALVGEPCLVERSYSDFLRFKRAARTTANRLLQ